MEFILILIVLIFGIAFLFLAFRILLPFFHGINNPLNGATRFMLLLTLIGFGFNLYEFSMGGVKVLEYYFSKSNFISGLGIFMVLLLISFISAMILFRISNGVINIISKENIKVELIKNNVLIAGIHGVAFLILVLLLKGHFLMYALSYIK
jgi:hypothetical protein